MQSGSAPAPNLASHIHAHAAQLAAATLTANVGAGVPLSHTLPPMAPIAYTLNHQIALPGAGLNHHQNQFNYMYSEGSEEEVDSEG